MTEQEKAISALKGVLDPHTGVSVWDMGLIHDLKIEGEVVSLTFIPTSPFCPLGIQLAVSIKSALLKVDGIRKAKITVQGHLNAVSINEMLAKD